MDYELICVRAKLVMGEYIIAKEQQDEQEFLKNARRLAAIIPFVVFHFFVSTRSRRG